MKFRTLPIISILIFNISFGAPKINLKKYKKKGRSLSLSFVSLSEKSDSIHLNENKPMVLASVSKIFSLYYALSILGGEYRFQTELKYTGNIKDGTLKGDLYLIGSGDPYLTSFNINTLLFHTKKFGISKIEGQLIFDHSALKEHSKVSDLGLGDQPDNSSYGALNAEFNRFQFWNRSLQVSPPLSHIKIKRQKKVIAYGAKFVSSKSPQDSEVWIRQEKYKHRRKSTLPTRKPALFTAHYFEYMAKLDGLTFSKVLSGKVPVLAKSIYIHESPPLYELAKLALEYSNNMFTELQALKAAQEGSDNKITTEQAASKMKNWFKNEFPKQQWKHSSFVNASGLTVKNFTNTLLLSNFLSLISNKSFQQVNFQSLLSLSGNSGWLAKRLDRAETIMRVKAKTGSLDFVSNIAGYVTAKSGKKYAFSILMSDEKRRKLLNGSPTKKMTQVRRPAAKWSVAAKEVQNRILTEFIKRN